jgi:hypothetical protein
MKKTAVVYTNDKNLPQQDLVIFGQVENFVTISPKNVSLRGVAGDPIESLVTIVPEKKYPFKIIDAKAQNGENIKIELKELAKSNGGGYELKVENLKATTGRYYDTIILKTDSSVQPELNVRVYGYLRPRKSE